MDKKKLSTVLITGGSKGIGLELAKIFASNGFELVLVARSEVELQRVADKLKKDYDCRVTCVSIDLATGQGPADLFQQMTAAGIQVDVLVNNAGVGDHGYFAASDLDRQLAMLRLNILSMTALTHLFLPGMIERKTGRILNVSSLVAFFSGGSSWAGYVASKHYVLTFSRGLAKELAGTGVAMTVLCPGPTDTDFVLQAGVGHSRAYRWLPQMKPVAVAKAGFHAVLTGRTVVVPGLTNKILALLGELPPRAVAQAIFGYLSQDIAATS